MGKGIILLAACGVLLISSSFSDGRHLESYCEWAGNIITCAPGGTLKEAFRVGEDGPRALKIDNPYIRKINSDAFQNLDILELVVNFSDEAELSPGSFNGLPMLESLSIYNYKLQPLDVVENFFGAVPSLLKLSFLMDGTENKLGDVLSGLPKLQDLNIGFTGLEEIDRTTFSKIESPIISLQVTGKLIKSIEPRSFSALKNLVYLEISDTQLEELGYLTFKGLEKLEELHVYRSLIEKINWKNFIGLDNLKKLSLCNNNLKKIEPYTFIYMRQLTFLDLGFNEIREISDGAFSQLKLDHLDLGYNRLTGIFNKNLKNFTTNELNLRENTGIVIVPGTMENIKAKKIYLTHGTMNNDGYTVRMISRKRENKIHLNEEKVIGNDDEQKDKDLETESYSSTENDETVDAVPSDSTSINEKLETLLRALKIYQP